MVRIMTDAIETQAVTWALLQFVWQGAAVGAITAVVLFALRRCAADVRYVVASISMALMFTLPVVTGAQRYASLARDRSVSASTADSSAAFPLPANASFASTSSRPAAYATVSPRARAKAAGVPLASMLLIGWLAGVASLTLRLLTGWIWMQRTRSHGVRPVEPAWEWTLARLARSLHVTRRIALFESTRVDVPTVIGWLKPVVLLPASALSALSPDQLEAILVHELAHIRRHDYLVNLLQTLVETLLFYHPAVWWVSRRIRIERENCCDDLAVALCGDPIAYANALADLESSRLSTAAPVRRLDRTALAATGGSLLHRVRRLLGASESHSGRAPAWLAAGAALLLVAGATVGADVPPMPSPAPSSRPAAPPQSISVHSDDHRGHWAWSDNGERLEVDYSGSFAFTDDDTDVSWISPGGYLKISDGAWLGRHSVEIAERGGRLERRFFVNGLERPFEPEGRAWLAQNLPRFLRNSGLAAPSRVARLLKSGGVPAVLAEINRIDGRYIRGVYYRELFKQATLTPDQYRQVLAQASAAMKGSDYELGQLLITIADRLPSDEASRAAYFNAAASIRSSYETRRVYSAMLKKGPVPPAVLAALLDHARSMNSDYDVSELLREILSHQALDDRNRAALFAVVSAMRSDYERHRVLNAVIRADGASSATVVEGVLRQAETMTSDHERATLLTELLKQNGIEGNLRAPFFRAVDAIRGSYERGRVLHEVVVKPDASNETLKLAIGATHGLPPYETSQVLVAIATAHPISGDLRDAYVQAADRLDQYSQGRVMTALVRSERR